MGRAEKAVKGSLRLIVVTPDGVEESERCPVVHQTVARADTPKRRRSHTVGRRKTLCDVSRPQVVQQDPKYADAYYQLGKLELEAGDAKQAISNLESAVALSPRSDYIHYQLSLAYGRDARSDDAQREMKLYQALKTGSRGDHEQPRSN